MIRHPKRFGTRKFSAGITAGHEPRLFLCGRRRAQGAVGEGKIILLPEIGASGRTNNPGHDSPHGDPRLHKARIQPISEYKHLNGAANFDECSPTFPAGPSSPIGPF